MYKFFAVNPITTTLDVTSKITTQEKKLLEIKALQPPILQFGDRAEDLRTLSSLNAS